MLTCKRHLGGSFLVKKRYLEKLLKAKGQNKADVWRKIIEDKGSVQNLEFLNPEERKKVFKTAYELDMKEVVIHAGERQI